MDYTIYKILLWAVPTLLAIIGFVCIIGVNAFIKMRSDISDIKNSVVREEARFEAHDERIVKLEKKVGWT